MRGRLDLFSLDVLVDMADRIGLRTRIIISRKRAARGRVAESLRYLIPSPTHCQQITESIFDLLRRNEHDAPVFPLRDGTSRALVIANGLADGVTRLLHDALTE
jgi:hypothetical protein